MSTLISANVARVFSKNAPNVKRYDELIDSIEMADEGVDDFDKLIEELGVTVIED